MSWFRLCVVRVFNLQPTRDRRVRSALSLRNDAFQITSHDLVEQIHASSFGVFPAQNIRQRAILNQCPQLFFPFYQRELAACRSHSDTTNRTHKISDSHDGT